MNNMHMPKGIPQETYDAICEALSEVVRDVKEELEYELDLPPNYETRTVALVDIIRGAIKKGFEVTATAEIAMPIAGSISDGMVFQLQHKQLMRLHPSTVLTEENVKAAILNAVMQALTYTSVVAGCKPGPELKPCPFCGEQPKLEADPCTVYINCCVGTVVSVDHGNFLAMEDREKWDDKENCYPPDVVAKVVAEAKRIWNTRAGNGS